MGRTPIVICEDCRSEVSLKETQLGPAGLRCSACAWFDTPPDVAPAYAPHPGFRPKALLTSLLALGVFFWAPLIAVAYLDSITEGVVIAVVLLSAGAVGLVGGLATQGRWLEPLFAVAINALVLAYGYRAFGEPELALLGASVLITIIFARLSIPIARLAVPKESYA